MDTNRANELKRSFLSLLYRTGPAVCFAGLITFAPAKMEARSPLCAFLSSKELFPFCGLCLSAEAALEEDSPGGAGAGSGENDPAAADPVSDEDGSGTTEDEGPEEGEYYEEDPVIRDWPEEGIALRIPVPNTNLDTLFVNAVMENQFAASLDLTEEDYQRYIEDCRAGGFALDEDYTESRDESWTSLRFYALDSDGYKLRLEYIEESGGAGSMYINISAPIPLNQIQWPDRALGLLVPVPPTTLGRIGGAPEIFLVSYLGNMSKDAWRAYIEACKEAGFDQNISETATTFSSEDSDGIRLTLNYEGANIVYFNLFDPEQKWKSKGPGGRDEDSQGETPSPAEEGTTIPGTEPAGPGGSGENESGPGGLPDGEEPSNAAPEEASFADPPYEEPIFIGLPDPAPPLASDPFAEAGTASDLNDTGPEAGSASALDFTGPEAGSAVDMDLTDSAADPAAEYDLAESSGGPASDITFIDPAPETAVTTYTPAADPPPGPSHISEVEREGLPVPGSTQTLVAASSLDKTQRTPAAASSLDKTQRTPAAASSLDKTQRTPAAASSLDSGQTGPGQLAFADRQAGSAFRLSAGAARRLEAGLTGNGTADLYDPFQDPALAGTYGLLMQEAQRRAPAPPGTSAAASGAPSAGSAPQNSLAGILAVLLTAMAVTAGAVTRRVGFKNSLQ